MRKVISLIAMLILLSGCASTYKFNISHKIHIGMTKGEVIGAYQHFSGYPINYTRKVINGHTYETLYYGFSPEFVATFDFVDNVLVGYYDREHYHTKDGVEDIKNQISSKNK